MKIAPADSIIRNDTRRCIRKLRRRSTPHAWSIADDTALKTPSDAHISASRPPTPSCTRLPAKRVELTGHEVELPREIAEDEPHDGVAVGRVGRHRAEDRQDQQQKRETATAARNRQSTPRASGLRCCRARPRRATPPGQSAGGPPSWPAAPRPRTRSGDVATLAALAAPARLPRLSEPRQRPGAHARSTPASAGQTVSASAAARASPARRSACCAARVRPLLGEEHDSSHGRRRRWRRRCRRR